MLKNGNLASDENRILKTQLRVQKENTQAVVDSISQEVDSLENPGHNLRLSLCGMANRLVFLSVLHPKMTGLTAGSSMTPGSWLALTPPGPASDREKEQE